MSPEQHWINEGFKQVGSLNATTLPGIKAPPEKLSCLSHLLYGIVLLVLNKQWVWWFAKILFVVSARPVSSELCDILSPESGAGNPTDRAESRGNCHLQREVWDIMKLPNISGDYYSLLWPLAMPCRLRLASASWIWFMFDGSANNQNPLFASISNSCSNLNIVCLLHYYHLPFSFLNISLAIFSKIYFAEYSTIY